MDTILIIIGLLVLGAGVTIYFIKKQKIKDTNKNYIPDVIEDKIEETKETISEARKRAKRVKEEIKDVVEDVKHAVNQSKDIIAAVKGKKRKGRKSKIKNKL